MIIPVLLCLALHAQEAPSEENTPPQHNFLFIVDTSGSMAPFKTAAADFIRDLVASGFQGQIEEGDSIDIWLYDSENHIHRFPPLIWAHARKEHFARSAAEFVQSQKFQGRGRFEPVASDLRGLLPHTSALLVVLITDAEEPLTGASFEQLNEELAKHRRQITRSRHPAVISLSAIDGKLQEWRIFTGERTLELPPLPSRTDEPEPMLTVTEPEPPAVVEEKAVEEPPPPVVNFPPGARVHTPAPVIEPEPKNAEAKVEVSQAPTVGPPRPAGETAAPERTTEEKKLEPAGIESAVAPGSEIAREGEQEEVLAKHEEPSPVRPLPLPIPATNPVVALTAPATPPNILFFAVGAGIFCLCLGTALFLRRRRTFKQSSISRSLDG